MANNVYIGNRYVPVFANPVEWDNLREYEPLTIVTYQGTAYTSKKTVPVGTALNDTNYWVVTGNYNAQVEQYRQEVEALATQLSQETTARIAGDTNEATDRINSLHHKNIICIGDSYSDTQAMGFNTWVENLQSFMPYASIYKKANNGGGFTINGVTTGKTFLGLLQQAYAEVNPYGITDIIVVGGSNDRADNLRGAIENAISQFVSYAREHFVNARIHIGFCGWTNALYAIDDSIKFLKAEKEYEKCVKYGCGYIANLNCVMHDYGNYSTTAHPNADKEVEIAEFISMYLNGGTGISNVFKTIGYNANTHWTIPFADYSPIVSASRDTDTTTITVSSKVDNGLMVLGFDGTASTTGPNIMLLLNDDIYRGIGIVNQLGYPNNEGMLTGTTQVAFTVGGSIQNFVPATVKIYNGFVCLQGVNNMPTNFSEIRIMPFTINVPTKFA